jgi:hypothetical protein
MFKGDVMKRFFSLLALIAVLALPVSTFVACTTTQVQSAVAVEYKTLSGIVNTVAVARGAYDTLYKAGKIPADLDAKVLPVYTQYQAVANAAITAAKLQLTATTPAPNDFIPQLESLVNQLFALFGQASGIPAAPVTISRKAGL